MLKFLLPLLVCAACLVGIPGTSLAASTQEDVDRLSSIVNALIIRAQRSPSADVPGTTKLLSEATEIQRQLHGITMESYRTNIALLAGASSEDHRLLLIASVAEALNLAVDLTATYLTLREPVLLVSAQSAARLARDIRSALK